MCVCIKEQRKRKRLKYAFLIIVSESVSLLTNVCIALGFLSIINDSPRIKSLLQVKCLSKNNLVALHSLLHRINLV